jgi:hypothetical protein
MAFVISFSQYFAQNVEFLSKQLDIPMTVQMVPGATHHIFSGHDAVKELLQFQKDHPDTKYILYQSENIRSAVFTPQYIQLMRQSDVFQYSPLIANYCMTKWGVPCKSFFTFGYFEPSVPRGVVEYVIVFFGAMTKRRYDILKEIQHVFKKYRMLVTNDCFNEDLDEILCKTDTVINISAYDDNALETHRINKCLIHGVRVVSNPSYDKLMNAKYAGQIIFTKGRHVSHYISALSKLLPTN